MCISSYAAAGIANSHPWKTALARWKAAKGYTLFQLVATSPVVPATWEGNSALSIFLAILTATIAMIVFSVVLERYYMRMLNWFETGLFSVCCVLLMLPQQIADFTGIAMFMTLTIFVYTTKERQRLEPAYE